jgi:hypothetical protein
VAADSGGQGSVLAAISEAPFRVDQFTLNGRWDLQALSTSRVREDPESGLLQLVDRMKTTNQRFEYDVATYVVSQHNARDRDFYAYPYAGYGWWGYDPWWGYGRGFGLGLSVVPRGFYGSARLPTLVALPPRATARAFLLR